MDLDDQKIQSGRAGDARDYTENGYKKSDVIYACVQPTEIAHEEVPLKTCSLFHFQKMPGAGPALREWVQSIGDGVWTLACQDCVQNMLCMLAKLRMFCMLNPQCFPQIFSGKDMYVVPTT